MLHPSEREQAMRKTFIPIAIWLLCGIGVGKAQPPQPVNGCPPGWEVCIPEWSMDCKQHGDDGWLTPACWKARKP